MFKWPKKQVLALGGQGIAAAAFLAGTTAHAQETLVPQQKTVRYVTDPAEIEALLAACGLKAPPSKSRTPSASTPQPGASGETPKTRTVRCNVGGPGDLGQGPAEYRVPDSTASPCEGRAGGVLVNPAKEGAKVEFCGAENLTTAEKISKLEGIAAQLRKGAVDSRKQSLIDGLEAQIQLLKKAP